MEGLSDREAVGQLATNIAWKAATGLALTDEAFHSTVLVLWRNKLRASTSPQRIFDAVRAVVVESKVLEGKTRRALDSTVLDDAVARQDTVTMLVAQIRRVQRLIPELGSVWVREHNLQGGRPPCDWDDPDDRDRLVSELVDDANELVWAAETLELTEAQADAVALLALVAGQDVEPGDGPSQWRIARRTAPDRAISTDDFDTIYRRHRPMIERTIAWLVKDNHRRLRYRGTQRNHLGWSHRCAAVNLKRLLTLGLTWDNRWAIT